MGWARGLRRTWTIRLGVRGGRDFSVVFSDAYVPHHAWRDRRLDRQRKRKVFFSEEKKQKTFDLWRGGSPDYVRQSAKVFWFFFSKKNGFLWCR
jgi:hypothetical protein